VSDRVVQRLLDEATSPRCLAKIAMAAVMLPPTESPATAIRLASRPSAAPFFVTRWAVA
jgi:hypothetical protein